VRHANNSAKQNCKTGGVRWTHTTTRGFRLSKLERNHSENQRNKHKNKLLVVVVSFALTAPIGSSSAVAASYSIDHLKLYAHSRILNYKEFQCFNQIITKESRWSYTARNGSHYGLGQMRSKHYRDLDPFRQIDSSLQYITKRYKTNCNALTFHNRKGYY
jgi:hypothetical protein